MIAQRPLLKLPGLTPGERRSGGYPGPLLLVIDLAQPTAEVPCVGCGALTLERDLVTFNRGDREFSVCPACANPGQSVRCDACGEAVPFALVTVDPQSPFIYCPCIDAADLSQRAA